MLRCAAWVASSCDACRICDADSPDCAAAWLTPPMLLETSAEPADACSMLVAISLVAADCSSTAAAMALEISSVCVMILEIY